MKPAVMTAAAALSKRPLKLSSYKCTAALSVLLQLKDKLRFNHHLCQQEPVEALKGTSLPF